MTRVPRIAGSVLVFALAVAACGVQSEQTDRPLGSGVISFVPREEPTTTTSDAGNRVTSTSVPPTSSVSYPLDVYWISGTSIRPERRPTTEADLRSAVQALRNGPTEEETARGLRSAIVSPDMILATTARSGTVTIDLGPSFLTLPGTEQTLAVAQIVFTLTIVPGIGQVELRLDGQPLPVPRGDGQSSTGTVSRDDYLNLVFGYQSPTSTPPQVTLPPTRPAPVPVLAPIPEPQPSPTPSVPASSTTMG